MILAFYFVLSLLLGLTVLFRGSNQRASRILFTTIVLISLWHGSVYVLNRGGINELVSIRLAFVFASASLVMVYAFVNSLSKNLSVNSKFIYYSLLPIILLIASPLVISDVSVIEVETKLVEPSREFGYFIVLAWIFFVANLVFVRLFKYYRHASHVVKAQTRVILVGLILGISVSVITNVVLPNLTSSAALVEYSPFGTLVFEAMLVYAIVRHKFLDIRLIAARTVAYILLLTTFAATFFIVGSISSTFLLSESLSAHQTIYYATVSIVLAVMFQPLKNYFDYLTDQFFFRHHYDTQEQLNKLSSVMVSEYEIEPLASQSLKVIADTVRTDNVQLILIDSNGEYFEDYTLGEPLLSDADEYLGDFEDLEDYLNLSVYEHIESAPSKIHRLFEKHDIEVFMRLQTTEQKVGYLLVGKKLSGTIMRSQDEQFLNIASNELSVAVLNARRFAEINSFNETLKLEIDRATSQLKKSNTKLLELDEAKDEFITMASHQLRTPLTSVKGYLSMVLEGDVGKVSKEQRDLLENAFVSAQRMVYLIADLLNVSRLKTGKFVIEKTQVDLPTMIEEEIRQLSETAKQRKLKIEYKKPKKFPKVSLDENKIRQVIMNFIDNAIYYTPSGGKIEVKLSNKKDAIELRVEDNGIGVPKPEQHKLFNKFYRANNARKARPDGTGLGLFMAKKVIIAQGGIIIFDSTENKGSTFGFSFPKKRVLK